MFVQNPNSIFTWGHNQDKVYQGHKHTLTGRITKVLGEDFRTSQLSNNYSVQLADFPDIVLEGVRLSKDAGFNGVGTTYPLEIDTPVVLSCKNGILQDAVIVGTYTTEGDYEEYYRKGNLQCPDDTVAGSEYNQPLGHPNRITQEDSYFHVQGAKNVRTPFDSPDFYDARLERSQVRPVPGSIEFKNQVGAHVQYTTGAHVIYADGNIIQISGGSTESKATALLEAAAYHSRKAQLLNESANGLVTKTESVETAQPTSSGMYPIVQQPQTKPGTRSFITQQQRAKAEADLAKLSLEAAGTYTQTYGAFTEQAINLQKKHGNEITNKPSESQQQPGQPTPAPAGNQFFRNLPAGSIFSTQQANNFTGPPTSN